MYGDVHRVKIMFNKKENALVQMADASQAQLGTDSGDARFACEFLQDEQWRTSRDEFCSSTSL